MEAQGLQVLEIQWDLEMTLCTLKQSSAICYQSLTVIMDGDFDKSNGKFSLFLIWVFTNSTTLCAKRHGISSWMNLFPRIIVPNQTSELCFTYRWRRPKFNLFNKVSSTICFKETGVWGLTACSAIWSNNERGQCDMIWNWKSCDGGWMRRKVVNLCFLFAFNYQLIALFCHY